MVVMHTCNCSNCTLALQVASYEFTTLTCIPGVVRYRGAKIQLLDLPGIIEGAKDGKGRGRQVTLPTTATAVLTISDASDAVTDLLLTLLVKRKEGRIASVPAA